MKTKICIKFFGIGIEMVLEAGADKISMNNAASTILLVIMD
jgi:imidazole glycerol phosphate synthase subunit HisF